MPRVSRKAKRRRAGYTEDEIRMLLKGYDFFGGTFGTTRRHGPWQTPAMKAAWEHLRSELLPEYIRNHPGQRPYSWWLYEAPERRQRVDGVQHPFDDRVRKKRIEEVAKHNPAFPVTAYELQFGIPRCVMPGDIGAEYESETAYLIRLNLLTPEERKELL